MGSSSKGIKRVTADKPSHSRNRRACTGRFMEDDDGMTARVLFIAAGEDIKSNILSFVEDREVVIISSGHGSVSAVNIKYSNSDAITYEGRFDIAELSGAYINNVDAPHGPAGGLRVMLDVANGDTIRGPVEEFLIAASLVKVRVRHT